MPRIELTTPIEAPAERVFDLARSIDLHVESAAATREEAIAGRTRGLIEEGEEVVWRARHLGCWHRMTVRITGFDRPRFFRDEQVAGPFRRMSHDHVFEAESDGTTMRDVLDFASPWGPLGRLAAAVLVHRHLKRFLIERNRVIRRIAESDGWRRYLGEG